MNDLVGHLVDAPLANILIVAGLAFLGIAILGKISGKIEPSTAGRIMAGVLGAVLLMSGVYAHVAADSARNQTQQTVGKATKGGSQEHLPREPVHPTVNSLLAGRWNNDNPSTRGITRLEIQQSGDGVLVRAWGPCSPQDCDWGTERGVVSAGSANVAWDQGFVLRKMTITPDAGRLRVVVDSVYRDNRPPHRLEMVANAVADVSAPRCRDRGAECGVSQRPNRLASPPL